MRRVADVSVPAVIDGVARSFTARDLARHAVQVDQRFVSNFEGIRLGLRVHALCTGAGTGVLALEEADWAILCEALRNPAPLQGMPAYPLSPAHVCVPLVEAVLNAEQD